MSTATTGSRAQKTFGATEKRGAAARRLTMARLTDTERAYFEPVDRQIGPMSNLAGSAQMVADRVETEVKARLAHSVFPPILDLLVELRGEFEDGYHHELEGHDNVTVHAETCMACRVQVIIDRIMEALL